MRLLFCDHDCDGRVPLNCGKLTHHNHRWYKWKCENYSNESLKTKYLSYPPFFPPLCSPHAQLRFCGHESYASVCRDCGRLKNHNYELNICVMGLDQTLMLLEEIYYLQLQLDFWTSPSTRTLRRYLCSLHAPHALPPCAVVKLFCGREFHVLWLQTCGRLKYSISHWHSNSCHSFSNPNSTTYFALQLVYTSMLHSVPRWGCSLSVAMTVMSMFLRLVWD